MSSDEGPVVQSALLRDELVRLRTRRGLTQQQVAVALEWSPSKLIRVEGGKSSITKVDLDALLGEYGVTSESHRERLQALNRRAKEPGWWESYKDGVSPTYLSYVGYEAGAASIRQFQTGFIPALLQTPEYSEIVTIAGSVGPRRASLIVGLRLQRQAELARRSVPPRQIFVLDEGVIRRHVGIKKDRAIMPNQLRCVADRAESDDLLTVRVLPFEAGAHPGLDPFTLLQFDAGLPDTLFLDADRGAFTMITGDDPQVAKYVQDFEDLIEDAWPAGDSIEFVRKVADEME
ncbi:MAG TPA: helix-turn-helix transcriptional regulator [Streptosporangiaceae bacterium]|nr:helix-turn-helix transcriptional regulator [Streptosporangiaceae bacterium]